MNIERHLKKFFSPDIGVEPSSQVLDILEYAFGLILGLALISTENPNFEMASSILGEYKVHANSMMIDEKIASVGLRSGFKTFNRAQGPPLKASGIKRRTETANRPD
jgi:hypothetical protein